MTTKRSIYCCACEKDVQARLTNGEEIYPNRSDLAELPFWRCDKCGNHVSCHHRHHDRSKRLDPQGVIATKELKAARSHIHRILDPIWKGRHMKRHRLYRLMAQESGWDGEFHIAEIRSMPEARRAWKAVKKIRKDLGLQ